MTKLKTDDQLQDKELDEAAMTAVRGGVWVVTAVHNFGAGGLRYTHTELGPGMVPTGEVMHYSPKPTMHPAKPEIGKALKVLIDH